jgi:hypothetical protein
MQKGRRLAVSMLSKAGEGIYLSTWPGYYATSVCDC